jgi:hypothetical protein
MTNVPTDLYLALLDFGIEHDEAVKLCQEMPPGYAKLFGPVWRARGRAFKRKIEEIENRLTALERADWRP